MKLLAIDTSTEACSAALYIDGKYISQFEIAPRRHTELILPMIEDLMQKAGLNVSQLDGLAFGRGPGAFTGIRIATGIIQGIAFAADLPVIPVSSLAALAQGCWREHKMEHVISAIDARMGEIYCGYFELDNDIMKPCTPETVCAPDQLELNGNKKWFGAGSGWSVYNDQLSFGAADHLIGISENIYPNAVDICTLSLKLFENGQSIRADQVSPVYLRDNVVT